MTANAIKTSQGAAALVGITLGVIPLIQYVVRGAPGNVWRLLTDGEATTLGWAGPAGVVVVALGLILLLERGKGPAA